MKNRFEIKEGGMPMTEESRAATTTKTEKLNKICNLQTNGGSIIAANLSKEPCITAMSSTVLPALGFLMVSNF